MGIDRIIEIGGREIRYTDRADSRSRLFEKECGTELALPQRHVFFEESGIEYRLLQVRNPGGGPELQTVVYLFRSRKLPFLIRGIVPKLGEPTDGETEEFALSVLRVQCAKEPGFISLRLQPEKLEARQLRDFEARARRAGFRLAEPLERHRTLLVDLSKKTDEIFQGFSSKTRHKIRRGADGIIIRPLTDEIFIDRCRELENHSRSRTGGGASGFDFRTLFRIARKYPGLACVQGLFFGDNPDVLVAYVSAYRHGSVTEYTTGGSAPDPRLRRIPFNYLLLWSLIQWAHGCECRWFDLGGVTDGGINDPLAGISDFKRRWSEHEVEIGREMIATFHPVLAGFADALSCVRERLREAPGE